MAIVFRLDRELAKRKMRSKELAAKMGMTEVSISRLKRGNFTSLRLETLDLLCKTLNCCPADLLECMPDYEARSLYGDNYFTSNEDD